MIKKRKQRIYKHGLKGVYDEFWVVDENQVAHCDGCNPHRWE